ncbi:hypothetical protein LTR16_007157, partial [Cryomyces antarcticus]
LQRRAPASYTSHRYNSSSPLTTGGQAADPNEPPREEQPAYQMTFTCRPCSHRSSHRVSKQGYYHGTVLISCPSCKNKHLISDHLQIFSDSRITLEDIMREKGQLVKRGALGGDGDVEFWDDGTTTRTEPTQPTRQIGDS